MEPKWYGVKCIFEHTGLSPDVTAHVFEERIVLVRGTGFDEAIEWAEGEAREYSRQNDAAYLGYCNAVSIEASAMGEGTEVYSVMRETTMSPGEFITHYYDDGTDKSR